MVYCKCFIQTAFAFTVSGLKTAGLIFTETTASKNLQCKVQNKTQIITQFKSNKQG